MDKHRYAVIYLMAATLLQHRAARNAHLCTATAVGRCASVSDTRVAAAADVGSTRLTTRRL